MTAPIDVDRLGLRFDSPGVIALALVGSHARGDAGPFSDVDLVRLVGDDPGPVEGVGAHLIDGRLVVVGDVRPVEVESWFERPEAAVDVIAGLRSARPLADRAGAFAAVQRRAHAFHWDDGMRRRADAWAAGELVGLIEEVHKGLEGLRRGDVGRLLNARFGLSWSLSRAVQVQRGILLSGDNGFWAEVEAAVGPRTPWCLLRRTAFGVDSPGGVPPSLREQVSAGLRFYVATAEMLGGALGPADAALVAQTVERVKSLTGDGAP